MRAGLAVASCMLCAETTLVLLTHILTAVLSVIAVRSSAYVVLASSLLLALVYQRFTDSLAPIVATQLLCLTYITFAVIKICTRRAIRDVLLSDTEDDCSSESCDDSSDDNDESSDGD